MLKKKMMGSLGVFTMTVALLSVSGLGQEKIEGTVISTNLASCSVVPGKVGTCEGTFVLESKADGKPRQMTVKVTRDTTLKKGDDKLFLFQLQGAPVTVAFAPDKVENVAKSVIMKGR